MVVVIMPCSHGLWKEFLNHAKYDIRILITEGLPAGEYLDLIWNEDVYVAADLVEAEDIELYLREEAGAYAETATVCL